LKDGDDDVFGSGVESRQLILVSYLACH